MKVEINNQKPEFEPIVLTITIESKEELLSFYTRINEQGYLYPCKNKFKNKGEEIVEMKNIYDIISDICDNRLTKLF